MHKIYFLIVFCLLATISNRAFADCTNPAKSEGFIIYNKDHKVAQFCNGTDWIGMAGGTTSIMTGDTMVEGWPDAIMCNFTNPSIGLTIFPATFMSFSDNRYYYRMVSADVDREIAFNSDKTFFGYSNLVASNCDGKSISQLYTDGQAFNFVGAQPVTTDTLSGLSCTDGQVAVWDNGGSAWVCATSAGSDTLAALSCTDGQMVLYDTATTAWVCADVSASGSADNLGNHIATQTLDMANNEIDNIAAMTLDKVTGGAAPKSSSDNGVPSGAVMAFDLASCPTGWSEYTAARGRFPRGIDPTGTNDPDGVRTAGSVQTDAVGPHQHDTTGNRIVTTAGGVALASGADRFWNGNFPTRATTIESGGDVETRPKNFAVLYCRKD
jgi:hypothetical protein